LQGYRKVRQAQQLSTEVRSKPEAWPGFPHEEWPIVRNHTDPTDILKPEVFDINDPAWLNPHKAQTIRQFCN